MKCCFKITRRVIKIVTSNLLKYSLLKVYKLKKTTGLWITLCNYDYDAGFNTI